MERFNVAFANRYFRGAERILDCLARRLGQPPAPHEQRWLREARRKLEVADKVVKS